ncbi:MAG: BatA domain-containing protein [Prolixibacteraceae bacterium]
MSFIYPSFLWALGLILIPILIHLINLRRHRTVYFSNVNFLKKVKKQTQRKSKLKQLLIMTSRILLLIALIMAFAKPYIPTGNTEKQRANNVVGIYIDNSFSMNAEGPEGQAIESARQKAYAIVNGSHANTKFALLTNELSEMQNRFYSQNEMIKLIGEVQENHNWVMMSTVLLRFQNMMANFLFKTDRTIYVISDFQRFSADLSNFQPDSLNTYNFVPIPVNSVANIYIDSCWFDAPTHHFKQVELLNVRVVNHSETDYPQVPVNFYLNDSLKALASTNLDAGEQKVITLQYTNVTKGVQTARVEISDYPIVYDNTIYLSYNVKSTLNALLIQPEEISTSKNIRALFSNDEYIKLDVERADRLQISSLSNYSTILLNELKTIPSGLAEELVKYVKNGGTLVLIPHPLSDADSYNQMLAKINAPELSERDTIEIPMIEVAYQNPIYEDVFKDQQEKVKLPSIKQRFRIKASQQLATVSIISFADQTNALSETSFGDGKLFMFTFPLSLKQNEFVNHLLFLPTFYNIVLESSYNQKLYYVIGADQAFEIETPEQSQSQSQNLKLKHVQSGQELVPTILQQEGSKLRLAFNSDFDAGFYQIFFGENQTNAIAFNYLLKESNLSYYSNKELMTLVNQAGIENSNLVLGKSQELAATIKELDNGKQLWKLFLILGILFILAEAAIIKFWK